MCIEEQELKMCMPVHKQNRIFLRYKIKNLIFNDTFHILNSYF